MLARLALLRGDAAGARRQLEPLVASPPHSRTSIERALLPGAVRGAAGPAPRAGAAAVVAVPAGGGRARAR